MIFFDIPATNRQMTPVQKLDPSSSNIFKISMGWTGLTSPILDLGMKS